MKNTHTLEFAMESATLCHIMGIVLFVCFSSSILPLATGSVDAAPVQLVCDAEATPRITFGVARLKGALANAGLEVESVDATSARPEARLICVGKQHGPTIRTLVPPVGPEIEARALGPEGFFLLATGSRVAVIGGGDSGVLYGCLELANRVRDQGGLPDKLAVTDRPAFKLRGTCIGMQKPYLLPGRHIYEYPYTEELFPFFYDKTFWREYLDFLVDRRMNLLSLWNGHPFGSLVRLDDYPDAVEVSDEQFERNVATYRYIAEEADKRGIWVTQMFYNILLPAPLAKRHQLDTQLASPTPLAADYTRKAIAEFVYQYPNVGLHICLGEALLDVDHQVEWLTEVILPGVHDGMRRAGLQNEPPVMIRAHATDPSVVIPAALAVYRNLYTESKYNGESLTTWRPRGPKQRNHLEMAQLGSTHVVNVHILANLEPFRYGAQRFIKKSVQAARDRLDAGGLHVYPLAFWNWPYSADAADPPLAQIDRDWMWFDAWARYAWDPDIDANCDRRYWIGRLTEEYGSPEAAPFILSACNDAGECAPRLVRRLGITEGNRQTLSLGMTLDQLVNPERYNAYPDLWLSQAPPGERLQEYVRREWDGLPHQGETPPGAVGEALHYAEQAVASIDAAAGFVRDNLEEFERLRNDIHCIQALCQHYAAKADAARLVLRHRLSHDPGDLRRAAERLEESLAHYEKLTRLTDDTYRFANSLQIGHRRIPVRGVLDNEPAYFHWRQVKPLFEEESKEFVLQLSTGRMATAPDERIRQQLNNAPFDLIQGTCEKFQIEPGARVFSDRPATIKSASPALNGLVGMRMPFRTTPETADQAVEFEVQGPVALLIGYFRSPEPGWRHPPNPDSDARAHERGVAEPLLTNAISIEGMPPVDVYLMKFGPGRHRLELPGTGRYLVLGVVAAER